MRPTTSTRAPARLALTSLCCALLAASCATSTGQRFAESARDGGRADAGQEADAGEASDAGTVDGDAGVLPAFDGGPALDGGSAGDAGVQLDGGAARDGGVAPDAGAGPDGGLGRDGGAVADGGTTRDGGLARDAGTPVMDAGVAVCPTPSPAPALTVETEGGRAFTAATGWVVLTGRAPSRVAGATVDTIAIDGDARNVWFSPENGRWSYLVAAPAGTRTVRVEARAGAQSSAAVEARVTVPSANAATPADFGRGVRFVGSWLFAWFSGDPSWRCGSPWAPTVGFEAWDGSVAFARRQLLDIMDARLDFVGVQYDTRTAAAPHAYRFENVRNVLRAQRALMEEGHRPARLAMFFDTAVANELHRQRTGADIDVSTTGGRDEVYAYVSTYHREARELLGPRFHDAAIARYDGRPMLAFWHTAAGSLVGASDAFVRDLKARFATEFGVTPYVIGHPDGWASFASTDEVTLMFGPSQHLSQQGRDGAGKPTINLTPGFWNPVSNPHYLARQSGAMYESAWTTALARRAQVEHIYIDSWNETGEGSGIFEAATASYAASSGGPCGTWVHKHEDAFGPSPRHFIERTAHYAARWNDVPDDDAALIAHDLPAQLRPGERRLATVVLRNTGDRTWSRASGDQLAWLAGAQLAPDGAAFVRETEHAEATRLRGYTRGQAVAFTFELVAPCSAGDVALELRMQKSSGAPFGATVRHTVSVR